MMVCSMYNVPGLRTAAAAADWCLLFVLRRRTTSITAYSICMHQYCCWCCSVLVIRLSSRRTGARRAVLQLDSRKQKFTFC